MSVPQTELSLVERVLGAGGPVARALGAGYEARQQQLAMARAVAEAMESRSHLLVEAGTGVGKSFAYLAPAILRVLRGERVVIATNTISLQEQLIEKDIPALRATLGAGTPTGSGAAGSPTVPGGRGGTDLQPSDDFSQNGPSRSALPGTQGRRECSEPRPPGTVGVPTAPPGTVGVPIPEWAGDFKAALVKGRGNYLSVRRLQLASRKQDKLFADAASRASLHVIEDWAYDTTDGTLSTLPQLERPAVWDHVQSDSGNCMGRKCPENKRCFYQNARRQMEEAKLLVCNHALFFADLALRQKGVGFLPKYDHVVLDEAHNVEDVASEHFGLSLPEGRLWRLLGALYHTRRQRGFLPQLELKPDAGYEAIDQAVRLTMEADRAGRALFDDLARVARAAGGSGRVREANIVDNPLSPVMKELALRLSSLKGKVAKDEDRYELNAYIERAQEIGACCSALIEQSLEGCAYWVEVAGADRGRPRVGIACSPIEVAPLLRQRLIDQEWSVTFTSATLAVGGSGRKSRPVRQVSDEADAAPDDTAAFGHTITRLGAEGARAIRLGSPFPLHEQLRVLVDTRLGRPPGGGGGGGGDRRYEAKLADVILEHIVATDGGAFVLFTSLRSLDQMASALRHRLAEQGIQTLAQNRDGSRAEILRRFREDERAALFGAASFWQGVDVPGRGLRNVIITRLPFEPPDRPLTQARLEMIEHRGGSPFAEESLPRAIMRFKQGIGRVIRSARDSGQVVVLDARIATAPYGSLFRAALPQGVELERWPQEEWTDAEEIAY